MPRPDAADPRLSAARMVDGALREGRLPDGGAELADPAGRARAQRLALETLRNLARADAVLAPMLRKPPPPLVHALLRVAVVEMLALNGAPHGVVGSSIDAVRALPGGAGMAGMANAVLRRASAFAGWPALPVPRLPGWLRRRLVRAHGAAAVAAIEAAHLAGAALDLTLKPMPDADRSALIAALGGAALPGGSVRLRAGVQVSALPGFEAGQWWVQDAAAALPAILLGVRPGEAVLDLCAAPGGKTMQMAAAGARVTAVDVSAARLARLHENLARTGLKAEVVCADLLDWSPAAPADAVLLDAPCTATGTIRRHPELPWLRRAADLAELVALQARLLDRALGFLRPGGRLMFCTCSLLPEEGEEQVLAALGRHAGLRVLPLPAPAFGHATPEGGWRTLPCDLPTPGGVDGFYMALVGRDTP